MAKKTLHPGIEGILSVLSLKCVGWQRMPSMPGCRVFSAAATTQSQEFSLVCEEGTRAEEITRLIRIALQDRHAKKLNIDVAPAWKGGNLILPEIVYTSLDLVALTMSKVMVQMPAGAVFLSLKSLNVDITHLSDPSQQNF
ncbi:hypothetical protein FF2_020731 [Malus domestica]